MVAAHIVDAIRGRLAQSILGEIVGIHFHRVSNPSSARVLKITDQLFMFRIDTDHGQAAPEKTLLLPRNIAKLTIAIRMGRSCETLAIRFQTQSRFFNNRITVTWERL